MAEITTRTLCPVHPEELAIALCAQCGEPLCSKCQVDAVATDEVYCSDVCRETHEAATAQHLVEGLAHPFPTGWKIWSGSLATVTRHTAPIAGLIALIIWTAMSGTESVPPATILFIALLFVYGIALTGTLMSKHHTGLIRDNAYTWTLRRFIPWGVTWFLFVALNSAGYLAFIIPGIIVALRLFWADEFALAHSAGPITALKESWRLTGGSTASIFVFQFLSGILSWILVVVVGIALSVLVPLITTVGTGAAPLGLFLLSMAVFLTYGAIHAPEIAKFYGMYASQLHGEEPETPVQLGVRKERPAGGYTE